MLGPQEARRGRWGCFVKRGVPGPWSRGESTHILKSIVAAMFDVSWRNKTERLREEEREGKGGGGEREEDREWVVRLILPT